MKFPERLVERPWYPPFLWVYAIAAGLLIGWALPPKLFKGIEWFALIPFLLLLELPMRRTWDLFFFGWLSGVAAFGVHLWWFFDALPLIWLGISSQVLGYFLALFAWFLPVGFFAIFLGIFIVAVKKISRGGIVAISIVTVSLWPLFEYVRTWSYSLHPFAQGGGHIWGDHAGFLLLGYAVAEYETLRSFASILGIYGLSIVVLIPNILGFQLARAFIRKTTVGSQRRVFWVAGLVVLFLLAMSFSLLSEKGTAAEPAKTLSIAIIQTGIYPEDWAVGNFEYAKEIKEAGERLFREARDHPAKPALIVTPEAFPQIFPIEESLIYPLPSAIFEKLGAGPYKLLIDTSIPLRGQNVSKKNTTSLVDNHVGVREVYEKRFIMPWGEYLPYSFMWGAKLLGASSWLEKQLPNISYVPGESNSVFASPLGNIGLRTCSEVLSPALWRKTAAEGAEVFIFSSSEGILRGSARLHAQNLAMAQIHAAEFKKPVVYASNAGKSFAINFDGSILWSSNQKDELVHVFDLTLNKEKTPAARYSRLLPLLLALPGLLVVTRQALVMHRKNHEKH